MNAQVLGWHRLPDESAKAYDAFQLYLQEGSIDAAWRATNQGQTSNAKRAPGQWATWSSKHRWVERATAYKEHLAELDRLKWEERRKQLQEADWSDGQEVRKLVMSALPEATRFIARKEVRIKGKKGEPDQLIITESFNIAGLVQALTGADKLQRLATDEPTDNIQLTGAALDAYIAAQLARLAHGGEAGAGDAPEPDAPEADGGAE